MTISDFSTAHTMHLFNASRRFVVTLYYLSLLGCTWLAVTEAQVCRLLSTQPNLHFFHFSTAHMPTYAAVGLAGPTCSLHIRAQGSRQLAAVSSLLITSCLQVYATDIDIERFGARSLLQSSPASCNSSTLQAIAICTGLHIVCHVWGKLEGTSRACCDLL